MPTPWLCLQEDLRRAGFDPEVLHRITDHTMPESVYALRSDEVDAVQLAQPYAEELIRSGAGHLWYAAANRGPCSYTSFYARKSILEAKRDEMLGLVRGLYRTQKWLHQRSPQLLADVVRPYFPAVPVDLLHAAVARYRTLGIWGTNPILPLAGYERLKAGLVSSGFAKGTPFETAVDNSLAEQVVREDPASL